ncbi:MAG: Bax inhibitor-1/YccA family protein [Alphaproteobacteria bacterium]|nr:MAG: Bax inhibitor-1/YccA family protein [Alphaproteobacteria bacterium]
MAITRRKTIVSGRQVDGLTSYINAVFAHMSFGLFLTAFVAYFISTSPQLMYTIFSTPLRYIVLFAPILFVMFLSARIHMLSKGAAMGLFYAYATSIGISSSLIFIVYSMPSIANAFLTTSVLFGVMSIYGYVTKTDLTNMGSFLMMGLFGLVISSIINWFMQSPGLAYALSMIGSLIFVGLTAYDTQRIKNMYYMTDEDSRSKMAIFGALILYLDFINLFYMLLHLLGDRNKR